MRAQSEHHAVTYHFPDAYVGQNTKIRDTLNNLILKSPQSWQTSVGLPFFQIQGTVVEWDEVRFDVRLMQRVPYEGISRMQTSLRRRHRDRVVRRGLAMMIESDVSIALESFTTTLVHKQPLTLLVWLFSSTPPMPAACTLPTSSSPSATACRRPATSTRSMRTSCALPIRQSHKHCSLSTRAFADVRQLRLQLRPQQEPVRATVKPCA